METKIVPIGVSDKIDGGDIYWVRVVSLNSNTSSGFPNPVAGVGVASIAFDGGNQFTIFGLSGYISPAVLEIMRMQGQLTQAKNSPGQDSIWSAQIPAQGYDIRPWKRIDLVGPVVIEFSRSAFEAYPGPVVSTLIGAPGQGTTGGVQAGGLLVTGAPGGLLVVDPFQQGQALAQLLPWGIFNAPGAGTRATANRAAVAALRHIAHHVSATITGTATDAGDIVLRDGGGAGTVIQQWHWTIPANGVFELNPANLDIAGSVNTAMTFEMLAAPAATTTGTINLTGRDSN